MRLLSVATDASKKRAHKIAMVEWKVWHSNMIPDIEFPKKYPTGHRPPPRVHTAGLEVEESGRTIRKI
jgi:hypothetical protein